MSKLKTILIGIGILFGLGAVASINCNINGDSCELKPLFTGFHGSDDKNADKVLINEFKTNLEEENVEQPSQGLDEEYLSYLNSYEQEITTLTEEWQEKNFLESSKAVPPENMEPEELQNAEDSLHNLIKNNTNYLEKLKTLQIRILDEQPSLLEKHYSHSSLEIRNDTLSILEGFFTQFYDNLEEFLYAANQCYESRVRVINLLQNEGIDYTEYPTYESLEDWFVVEFQKKSDDMDEKCIIAIELEKNLAGKQEKAYSSFTNALMEKLRKLSVETSP